MNRPRILITGSRDWDRVDITKRAILQACEKLGTRDVIVVHGACKGADVVARDVAISLGMMHEPHEVTAEEWATVGKKAGPLRNQKMVDLGADVCLAFPLFSSRGTFDCMRRAKDAGIPVRNWGFLSPKT